MHLSKRIVTCRKKLLKKLNTEKAKKFLNENRKCVKFCGNFHILKSKAYIYRKSTRHPKVSMYLYTRTQKDKIEKLLQQMEIRKHVIKSKDNEAIEKSFFNFVNICYYLDNVDVITHLFRNDENLFLKQCIQATGGHERIIEIIMQTLLQNNSLKGIKFWTWKLLLETIVKYFAHQSLECHIMILNGFSKFCPVIQEKDPKMPIYKQIINYLICDQIIDFTVDEHNQCCQSDYKFANKMQLCKTFQLKGYNRACHLIFCNVTYTTPKTNLEFNVKNYFKNEWYNKIIFNEEIYTLPLIKKTTSLFHQSLYKLYNSDTNYLVNIKKMYCINYKLDNEESWQDLHTYMLNFQSFLNQLLNLSISANNLTSFE
uniref:Uncharacterized protein n=1 Tax=Drosophila-associated filamentous virus TaxID=2743186 RepID=A0A6M9U087_9VIRU|nr:putative protein 29 [Drosophila-associated filamentous virus]